MRHMGMLEKAIAEKEGVTQQYVNKVLKADIKRVNRDRGELAEQYFVLMLTRLERQLQSVWLPSLRGNLQNVDRVLKILKQEAELLGLDMPKKIAQTTPDGTQPADQMSEEEIDARIEELIKKLNDDREEIAGS